MLSHWTAGSITSTILAGVAYGPGLFVAVGYNSEIWTSPDGLNWKKPASFNSTFNFLSVAYANGVYAATGAGKVWTTTDGAHWSETAASQWGPLNQITFVNNEFVTIGGPDGNYLTSADGFTWSGGEEIGAVGVAFVGITYGNGTWVAIDSSGETLAPNPSGALNQFGFSPVHAAIVEHPSTASIPPALANCGPIIFANGIFVAVGPNGAINTSPDDITWTTRNSGTTSNLYSATYAAGYFVVVGDNGTILSSVDGTTWTARDSGTTNLLRAVTYGNGHFVAVGIFGTVVVSSDESSPTITTQPANLAVLANQKASFSIVVSGTPVPSYQWYFNGKLIPGATSANYTIVKVSAVNAGNYTVFISNANGNITSTPALLTVDTSTVITSSPVSSPVTAGPNATVVFKVVATGNPTPSIQWQSAPAKSTVFSNLTNGGDFSSVTSANLTISNITGSLSGTQFRAVATNVIGNTTSSATSKVATLTVNLPAAIANLTLTANGNTTAGNVTVSAGQSVTFTVTATGTALKYQWLLNGVNIKGATKATYTIAKSALANSGNYTVSVTNAFTTTPATGGPFILTVLTKPAIVTQPKAAKTTSGGNATFSVTASGNPAPSFIWLHGGSTTLPQNVTYSNTTNPTTASSTIKLTNVTADYSGSYQANITNSQGSVKSAAPVLTVK